MKTKTILAEQISLTFTRELWGLSLENEPLRTIYKKKYEYAILLSLAVPESMLKPVQFTSQRLKKSDGQ